MKVVHIGLGGSSGSAAACRRLNKLLCKRNIQSEWIQLTFSKKTTYKGILRSIFMILKNRLLYGRVRLQVGFPFYTSEISVGTEQLKRMKDADIIHLHWVAGFFSFNDVKKILKMNKPIVWTCHDSWNYTGGCCKQGDCKKYVLSCCECQYIIGKKKKDISYWHYNIKKKLLCNENIVYIAPSNWMKQNIEESFLRNNKVMHINNIADFYTFRYRSNQEIIENFKNVMYDSSKINILLGADSFDLVYKGVQDAVSTLQLLLEQDANIVEKIKIFIVGNGWNANETINKFEHYYLGHINSEFLMSCVYSMADIFMFPSHEDNLPYMVIESLACGTPVLAYAIGGIPEIIEHRESGFLVKEITVQKYYQGLKWLIEHPLKREVIVDSIRNKFEEEDIIQQHINLYSSLVEKRNS